MEEMEALGTRSASNRKRLVVGWLRPIAKREALGEKWTLGFGLRLLGSASVQAATRKHLRQVSVGSSATIVWV
jgi:hypothetical protein